MSEITSNTIGSNNLAYMNEGFTIMRVDTKELLSELEAFYRGKRLIGYDKGNPIYQTFGNPRMNEKGLQDLMGWLKSIFNQHTVQGNTDDKELGEFIANLREDLAETLMTNINLYAISENDYNAIIDKTVASADLFISRTKDNLERDSYAQTTTSVERINEGEKGFNILSPFSKK